MQSWACREGVDPGRSVVGAYDQNTLSKLLKKKILMMALGLFFPPSPLPPSPPSLPLLYLLFIPSSFSPPSLSF